MTLSAAALQSLEEIVRQEMTEWGIGGLALALVDGRDVAYAQGFGEARRDSIFRVGSISKLFNAVAVVREIEEGGLEIDEPIASQLLPVNPFPKAPPVTLRQLLCHRSGLPRESPVGGYFDATQPGLKPTVLGARTSRMAVPPGGKTHYSNLGPSLAGLLLEVAAGKSFEDYLREHIHGPLGMGNSAWSLATVSRERLVPAWMRVADGRGGWTRRPAPLFDLGTIPAGNLYSTVDDLARFASAILPGGGNLVSSTTFEEMLQPQLTTATAGYGLGFLTSRFRDHRLTGHNGAVYGYSSSFIVLPDKGLAAIVLCNEDIVSARTRRVGEAALSLLLEAKFGERPPPVAAGAPPADPSSLAGDYESQSFWARIENRNGRLEADISGQPTRLDPRGGDTFSAHSRIENGTPLVFSRGWDGRATGFDIGAQNFARIGAERPILAPEWRARLGGYGPDFIPLVVREKHGRLYATTENMVDYRLTPIDPRVCHLPPGMYEEEEVAFLDEPDGRPPCRVNFAGIILRRAARSAPPQIIPDAT